MEPMEKLPKRGNGPVTRPDEQAITYEGLTFRHFQTSNPRVDAVARAQLNTRQPRRSFSRLPPPAT